MPNYCQNRATITGPNRVIDKIKSILESENGCLLNYMVPEPVYENDTDWYDWRVNNWGCKWSICNPQIIDDESTEITFEFETAWGPCVEAFHTWAAKQEGVEFSLEYFEPGVGFVGVATYQDEMFDDDFVSASTMSDTYKEMAFDLFGWEEEPEPEPLTDWYKQGVIDKGLE